MPKVNQRILFIVNVDWFFVSHRLAIAREAISSGYEVHLATSYTSQRHYIESFGIITHNVDFDRSRFKVGNFVTCLNLFLKVRPSIIHLITMQPIIIGGFLSVFYRSSLFVFAISGFGHVFNSFNLLSRLRKACVLILYALSLKLSSKKSVIVQNSRDYNLVRSFLIHPSNVFLIPGSGVLVKDFTPSPLPPYPPVVVFISRLLHTKGIDEFVKAAGCVVEKYPDAKFIIVGAPDFSNPSSVSRSYLDQISKLPFISYLGHRGDVYSILSSSHLLVLPSYYPEGLPKVLCEAAACARPVLTSNTPGCFDAIEQGITGIAIPPKDYQLLASTMINLLSDQSLLHRMSIASRHRAEALFDIDKIVDLHLLIYQSALK